MAWIVGQEVFDEVHYPGKTGVIIAVNTNSAYPIRVTFGIFTYDYTTEGRILENSLPTLKHHHYKVAFEEVEQTTTPNLKKSKQLLPQAKSK